MSTEVCQVTVSETDITTAHGVVRTPEELLELLNSQAIQKVKLRMLPGTGYDTIGRVIYALTRADVEIEPGPIVPDEN